ncbi:MAG: LytTR family transcriptional regulator DNA-binding domain-containing protein [Taibaiella sp.]|nr:LytTR family transcriptional regulator DNA-binding domain-containing protein [Taibaiella sp.]
MNRITIGIVEDESIIADDLQALLEDMGYLCPDPCASYNDAVEMIEQKKPDIVILDINLFGKPEGIRIAQHIRENYCIPFIFLTANSDCETVTKAKETRPDAYLVKPFQKADLYTSIEIALHNFKHSDLKEKSPKKKLIKNALFIKEGDYFHKVPFDEIIYLNSEHVYVTVHTVNKKFLVRTSMQEYLENFDPSEFVRVHRSYVANLNKIEKINSHNIIVSGNEIPISKNHRDELLKMLHLG